MGRDPWAEDHSVQLRGPTVRDRLLIETSPVAGSTNTRQGSCCLTFGPTGSNAFST